MVRIMVIFLATVLYIYELRFRSERSEKYKNILDGVMVLLIIIFTLASDIGAMKGIILLAIGIVAGFIGIEFIVKILEKKNESKDI